MPFNLHFKIILLRFPVSNDYLQWFHMSCKSLTMAPAILKLSTGAGAAGIIDFYKDSRDTFLFLEKIIMSFLQTNFYLS
jgi:hypothetical protein